MPLYKTKYTISFKDHEDVEQIAPEEQGPWDTFDEAKIQLIAVLDLDPASVVVGPLFTISKEQAGFNVFPTETDRLESIELDEPGHPRILQWNERQDV